MNFIFGTIGPHADAICRRVEAHAHAAYGTATIRVDAGHATFMASSPELSIATVRADGEDSSALSGMAQTEFEETADDDPMVDVERTADAMLRRFRANGAESLDGILGQYACAISIGGTLWLAGDPLGLRTLYLWADDETTIFSSNISVLGAALAGDCQLDRSYEDFFLLQGFHPFGRTVLAGVQALPPATVRRVDLTGSEPDQLTHENRPIAWPVTPPEPAATEDELVEQLHTVFMEALSDQLPRTPGRVGVLLGGFDSALVAAALHALGAEVRTYSFHYEQDRFNQPHTDTLASHLGIEHTWVPIRVAHIEAGLRRYALDFNQPTNWPNYVIQTAVVLERMATDGIRFAYSGDGCDSVFLGYPGTYRRARLFELAGRTPRRLVDGAVRASSSQWMERRAGQPLRVARHLLRSGQRDPAVRSLLSFRILDEASLRHLRSEDAPHQAEEFEDIAEKLAAPHRHLSPVRLGYQGKSLVSPNKNKMVGGADQTGISVSAPYLHPTLKAFALSIPEELSRPGGDVPAKAAGKQILMKMADATGLLPPEVIYQKKVAAVDAPIDEWYEGPLRPVLDESFAGLPFDIDPAFASSLANRTLPERFFTRFIAADAVVSHAASLLATYGRYGALVRGT